MLDIPSRLGDIHVRCSTHERENHHGSSKTYLQKPDVPSNDLGLRLVHMANYKFSFLSKDHTSLGNVQSVGKQKGNLPIWERDWDSYLLS